MGKIAFSLTPESDFKEELNFAVFFFVQNSMHFSYNNRLFCLRFVRNTILWDMKILIINVSYISYLTCQQSLEAVFFSDF